MSDSDGFNQGIVAGSEIEGLDAEKGAEKFDKLADSIKKTSAVQNAIKKTGADKEIEKGDKENNDPNLQKSWVDIAKEAGGKEPGRTPSQRN